MSDLPQERSAQVASDEVIETTMMIPEGFEPMETGGFFRNVGPWYWRRAGKVVVTGLRLEQDHCNLFGMMHGGLLATMVDLTLASSIVFRRQDEQPHSLSTLSLTVNYVDAAKVGEWVEGHSEISKSEGLVTFANCNIVCGSRVLAHASGVFRIKASTSRTQQDVLNRLGASASDARLGSSR